MLGPLRLLEDYLVELRVVEVLRFGLVLWCTYNDRSWE